MVTSSEKPTKTAAEIAYDAILRMLLQAELLPGELVAQNRLAKAIGCSTVPVTEALRRLETEGLLVKEPRCMARVRKLSPADIESYYLIREGLEPITARRCAQRVTDEQAEKLHQLSEDFDAAAKEENLDRCRELEFIIHQFIADCADCALLAAELKRLFVVRQATCRAIDQHPSPRTYPYSHRALVEAIKDRDEDMAEYLMRKHIRRGYETIRQRLGEIASNESGRRRRRKPKTRQP